MDTMRTQAHEYVCVFVYVCVCLCVCVWLLASLHQHIWPEWSFGLMNNRNRGRRKVRGGGGGCKGPPKTQGRSWKEPETDDEKRYFHFKVDNMYINEWCERSAMGHWWWSETPVWPLGCDVCYGFTSPPGDCLLQSLNSFFYGRKTKPWNTSSIPLHTTSLSVPPSEPQDFALPYINTHTHIRTHTHSHRAVCARLHVSTRLSPFIVKKRGERRERRRTSDLTAPPVTSHDITEIHSQKEECSMCTHKI